MYSCTGAEVYMWALCKVHVCALEKVYSWKTVQMGICTSAQITDRLEAI